MLNLEKVKVMKASKSVRASSEQGIETPFKVVNIGYKYL